MTKNSPAGERIAYAKRALEAAEFVDEAAAWAHRPFRGHTTTISVRRPVALRPQQHG
jgi:hypothetical protein